MPAARFRHIRELLWADVIAGTYGEQLPPEPELALRYQVSRMTLRRAIASLAEDGLLSAQQGRGTFINRNGQPTSRASTVAVVLEDHILEGRSDPYFGLLISALASRLASSGHALLLAKVGDAVLDPATSKRSTLCGVIAMGYDRESVWSLSATRLPLILLDSAPLPERTCILSENREGILMALRHLTSLGHRRIAHIAGATSTVSGHERADAWRNGLVDLGLAGGDTLFAAGDFTVDGGERAMTALLAASGGRPTAVVCGNDRMALGALRALRLHGLQVPQDVSLIGYDDIEAAELSVPALTTVTVPRHELAAAACQALLAEIADPTAARGQTIRLPVTFTVRASTGPARKGG
jgi:DNA-binding LacI/PurR family transcriptional regulator